MPHFKCLLEIEWQSKTDLSCFCPLVDKHGAEVMDFMVNKEDFRSNGLGTKAILMLSQGTTDELGDRRNFARAVVERGNYVISKKYCSVPTFTFFFDDSVEQVVKLARVLSKIPPAPFPKKCVGINLGFTALASHVNSMQFAVMLERCEVCFMDRNPFDVTPCGLRLSIDKQMNASVKLKKWSKHKMLPDPFAERILLLPGGGMWCINEFSLLTEEINARICTESSGSRGKFLFVMDSILVRVGGDTGGMAGASEGWEGGGEEMRMRGMMDFVKDEEGQDVSSTTTNASTGEQRKSLSRNSMTMSGSARMGTLNGLLQNREGDNSAFLCYVRIDKFKLLLTEETNLALLSLGKHIAKRSLELATSNFKPPSMIKDFFGEREIAESDDSQMMASSFDSPPDSPATEEGDDFEVVDHQMQPKNADAELSARAFITSRFDAAAAAKSERGAAREAGAQAGGSHLADHSADAFKVKAQNMMKLLVIEVREPQVQLVDRKNKECVVFALSAATLQNRCGFSKEGSMTMASMGTGGEEEGEQGRKQSELRQSEAKRTEAKRRRRS